MSTQVERFLAQAGSPFNYTELIGRVPAQILTDTLKKDIEETKQKWTSSPAINQTYADMNTAGNLKLSRLLPQLKILEPVVKQEEIRKKEIAALKIENINSSQTTIQKYNIQQEVKDENFKKYVGLGILGAVLLA